MRKVARLLAIGGVSAMTALTVATLPGTASANQNCNGYGTTSESVGGVTVAVQAGSGASGLSQDGDVTAVGVCGNEGLTPGFTGGTAEVGVDQAEGVLYGGVPVISTTPGPGGHTSCGWGGTDPQCVMDTLAAIPGVYVVAQGQDGNTIGTGQLEGYAGLSTYEHPNASGDGNSTNSGGEIGLEGISVYNIPSPIVCGDTSGKNWNDTSRQGCEIP